MEMQVACMGRDGGRRGGVRVVGVWCVVGRERGKMGKLRFSQPVQTREGDGGGGVSPRGGEYMGKEVHGESECVSINNTPPSHLSSPPLFICLHSNDNVWHLPSIGRRPSWV